MTMLSINKHVTDVYLEPATSKNGNSFFYLVIEFDDDYKKKIAVFGDSEYVLRRYAVD